MTLSKVVGDLQLADKKVTLNYLAGFFHIPELSGTAGPWGISFRSPQLDCVSSFVAAAGEQGALREKFGAEDS